MLKEQQFTAEKVCSDITHRTRKHKGRRNKLKLEEPSVRTVLSFQMHLFHQMRHSYERDRAPW